MSPLLLPAVQKICSSSITQVSVSPVELFPCNALPLCSSTQLLCWVSCLTPHLFSRLPSDSLNPYYLYQHAISIGHVFIFMTAQIDLLTFIYYVRSDVCMCAHGGRRTICRKWFFYYRTGSEEAQTHGVWLGGKCPYCLGHFSGPTETPLLHLGKTIFYTQIIHIDRYTLI